MRRAILLWAMMATVGSPASASKVKVDWDQQLDMTGWKTFGWADDSIPPPDELARERVESAILEVFGEEGMQYVGDGPTDFRIRYHAIVDQQTQQSSVRVGLGVSRRVGSRGAISVGGSTSPKPKTVEIGTLVVDLIDASTGKLAWTAKGSETLNGDPQKRKGQIESHLRKALKKFPPPK